MERLAVTLPGVETRIVARCRSTNTSLLALASDRRMLLAAETQTAGRGRRGRRWRSAPGASLTFSLALTLARPLRELPALSPLIGAALARSLRRLGVRRVRVKWPNDLLVGGAKLAGILIETRPTPGGTRAVIGVGINFRRSAGLSARVRRRIAFLDDFRILDRNAVLRTCAATIVATVDAFEAQPLALAA
jgi:BirA family biotin operon repressor/biotin-[acetyl-CoA-carboxylase] ligase